MPGALRRVTLVDFPAGVDFHPLGISIFSSSETPDHPRLFVPNLRRDVSSIDIFTLDLSTARAIYHLSISSPDLIPSPNAIAPISETEFFVTNDHRWPARLHPWLSKLETFLNLPVSWVTHIDFSASIMPLQPANTGFTATGIAPVITKAIDDICYANGILLLPQPPSVVEQFLLVASTCPSRSALHVYKLVPGTSRQLMADETIAMPFAADNLAWDATLDPSDDTVYDAKQGGFLRGITVAGHPAPLSLLRMAHNLDRRLTAPSWVVEVRRDAGHDGDAVVDAAHETARHKLKNGESSGWWLKTLYQSKLLLHPSAAGGY